MFSQQPVLTDIFTLNFEKVHGLGKESYKEINCKIQILMLYACLCQQMHAL